MYLLHLLIKIFKGSVLSLLFKFAKMRFPNEVYGLL